MKGQLQMTFYVLDWNELQLVQHLTSFVRLFVKEIVQSLTRLKSFFVWCSIDILQLCRILSFLGEKRNKAVTSKEIVLLGMNNFSSHFRIRKQSLTIGANLRQLFNSFSWNRITRKKSWIEIRKVSKFHQVPKVAFKLHLLPEIFIQHDRYRKTKILLKHKFFKGTFPTKRLFVSTDRFSSFPNDILMVICNLKSHVPLAFETNHYQHKSKCYRSATKSIRINLAYVINI